MRDQILKVRLTNGRTVELRANTVGQIYTAPLIASGLCADDFEAAELLGAAPCEVRYRMVHPAPSRILSRRVAGEEGI